MIEILVCLILALIWLTLFSNYPFLPDIIPTHFTDGKIDNYGTKNILFAPPVIATLLSILLTVLSRFPNLFRYAVKITERNIASQYRKAIDLLRYLKLLIVVVFLGIIISMIYSAKTAVAPGLWFPLLLTCVLFVPVLIILWKTKRA